MKKFKLIILLGILSSFVAFATVGCDKGPAEKAGEKIDEAAKSVKDAAKDATD